MRYLIALTALIVSPAVIELLPKDVTNTLATITMFAIIGALAWLTLWLGLKK